MAAFSKLESVQTSILRNLEADITGVRSAASLASIALPDYVEHQQGVTRAGALSAEAVLRDYETAAREMESMGAELIDAATRCEAMTAEVHNAIAYVRDTAAGYREDAKKILKRINHCALLTQDVRKTCEAVKRRMVEENNTN